MNLSACTHRHSADRVGSGGPAEPGEIADEAPGRNGDRQHGDKRGSRRHPSPPRHRRQTPWCVFLRNSSHLLPRGSLASLLTVCDAHQSTTIHHLHVTQAEQRLQLRAGLAWMHMVC